MCDDLPFHALLVVWSSACWAQAVHVVLDIVVTELANLKKRVSLPTMMNAAATHRHWQLATRMAQALVSEAYLISTGTWFEVTIREVELLDT